MLKITDGKMQHGVEIPQVRDHDCWRKRARAREEKLQIPTGYTRYATCVTCAARRQVMQKALHHLGFPSLESSPFKASLNSNDLSWSALQRRRQGGAARTLCRWAPRTEALVHSSTTSPSATWFSETHKSVCDSDGLFLAGKFLA